MAVRGNPATDRWPAAAASADVTPCVIVAIGLNRRALDPSRLPDGRILVPDCALAQSRVHRGAHPTPPNRVV